MPTVELYQERESWLSARTGIGGSDAPVVLGVSPYCSAYKLWATKTGRVPEDEPTKAMLRGIRMESMVADMVQEETGWEFAQRAPYTIHRHEKHDWAFCSIDREILPIDERGPGNLQIKTVNSFASHDWDDRPPLHVQVQTQHELFASGFKWGAIAAFFGLDDLRVYPVNRDDKFISVMVAKEQEFMRCVREDLPPEIDGSLSTELALKRLRPMDGVVVELPQEFGQLDERLATLDEEIDKLETEKRLIRNRITAALGDATYGLLPSGGRWQRKIRTRSYEAREAYTTEYPELRRLKK